MNRTARRAADNYPTLFEWAGRADASPHGVECAAALVALDANTETIMQLASERDLLAATVARVYGEMADMVSAVKVSPPVWMPTVAGDAEVGAAVHGSAAPAPPSDDTPVLMLVEDWQEQAFGDQLNKARGKYGRDIELAIARGLWYDRRRLDVNDGTGWVRYTRQVLGGWYVQRLNPLTSRMDVTPAVAAQLEERWRHGNPKPIIKGEPL